MRGQLLTRPPLPVCEAVRAEADRLGLTYSDYIANLLAAAHGFPPVVEAQNENQLKLTA